MGYRWDIDGMYMYIYIYILFFLIYVDVGYI